MIYDLDRRHIFFSLSLLLLILVIWRITPPSVPPIIRAKLSLQKGSINSIDTARDISISKVFYIDVIDFTPGQTLIHRNLGPIGYNQDFFMDFEVSFEVFDSADFVFEVNSDDGFRLWIDNSKISEFLKDRPIDITTAEVHLDKGKHSMRLSYFQGFGNLGLQAKYRQKPSSQTYYVGESSSNLKFIPVIASATSP